MTERLNGRVALVTGGAQGIGRAIAQRLADAGANVVIADLRDPADGSEWVELDVTSSDSVARCIDEIVERHGRLDIVVNNAGIMFEEDVETHSETSWQKMLDVNLTGPFLVTKAAVPHLKASKGAIVNVGSIEGFSSNPGHTAYAATKAGVHGLTGALAVDLGSFGIRANAVAPGWIDTELNSNFVDRHPDRDEVMRQLAELHPVGHIGAPTDVGDVVVWLASDEARFVTGQVITVDGGRLSKPPLPGILS
jgi:meso-butanediol dehydrogenase/(S,S)-butanediol dehydrogenase/diacetyl reductase